MAFSLHISDNDSLLSVLSAAEKHFPLALLRHQISDFDQGDKLDGHFVALEPEHCFVDPEPEHCFVDPGSVVGEDHLLPHLPAIPVANCLSDLRPYLVEVEVVGRLPFFTLLCGVWILLSLLYTEFLFT